MANAFTSNGDRVPPNRSRNTSSISLKRTASTQPKTEIYIHVYDLLPPGRLSSLLWSTGFGLLHSGVAINGKEYAYGGHTKRGVTGVYFTKPRFEPPGGTFRLAILQGTTYRSAAEIDAVVKEVSDTFLGPAYNLLNHNCNHFTSALCEKLTARAAPAWLNRAASVGLAFPCMVPRDWISPPDVETADGELVDNHVVRDSSERSGMMESDRRRRRREEEQQQQQELDIEAEGGAQSLAGGRRLRVHEDPPARLVSRKDNSGHEMPVAERAPIPISRRSN